MVLITSASVIKLLACLLVLFVQRSQAKVVFTYDEFEDHIKILDKSNFDDIVFGSDVAYIVEFYAHWCGRCKRWASHWKDLAKQTRLWHDSVMRVGAVDCAAADNKKLCRYHRIEFFPTFYMFEAHSQKTVGEEAYYEHGNEEFQMDMVSFIEKHPNRQATWPSFDPYEGSLPGLFKDHNNAKYTLLIFESEGSFLARKLMLDFVSYSQKFPIKRVHCYKNAKLCREFGVDPKSTNPSVFLVTNSKEIIKKFDKFQDVIDTLNRDEKRNTLNFNPDEIIPDPMNPRNVYMKMIKDFIEHSFLLMEDSVEF